MFLDDLLAYFSDKPDIYIEIEMKTRGDRYPPDRLSEYCGKLGKLVSARLPHDAQVVYSSFDVRSVELGQNVDFSGLARLVCLAFSGSNSNFIMPAIYRKYTEYQLVICFS
ncbi:MAG: hypothetical protein LC725_10485 [Lentisphaerae bacterium]|nr:hypothetical protein [Lentisphaerota bacterium]